MASNFKMFEEWPTRIGATSSFPPFGVPDHTYTMLLESESITDHRSCELAEKDLNWSSAVGLEVMGEIGGELWLSAERNGRDCRTRQEEPMEVCVEELAKSMESCQPDERPVKMCEDSDHNYSWNAVSDIETNFTMNSGIVSSPEESSDHSYACGDFIWKSMVVGEDHCYSRSLEAIIALPPHRTLGTKDELRHGLTCYWPDIHMTEHNYSSNQELNRAHSKDNLVSNMVRSRSEHLHVDHNYTHSVSVIGNLPERKTDRKADRKLQKKAMIGTRKK